MISLLFLTYTSNKCAITRVLLSLTGEIPQENVMFIAGMKVGPKSRQKTKNGLLNIILDRSEADE